jgi:translation initiation factor 2 alpha subunit (eIF-2alpha)
MIGKIGEASKDGSEKLSNTQAEAIKSLDNVLSSDFEKAYDMIKKIVEEVSKLGADIKVSSTIENLALVTAGTAVDLTGKRVEASVTNITTNVQNIFSGVKIVLEAGGKQLDAYIAEVVSE